MRTFDMLTFILLIVGGLNWGLVGTFNYDLVATLLGAGTTISKAVYSLVGISALYHGLFWQNIRQRCSGSMCCKK